MSYQIDAFWVVVGRSADGDEAVAGNLTPDGVWMPMFATGPTSLAAIKKNALRIAENNKSMELLLVKFTSREVVDRIVVEKVA